MRRFFHRLVTYCVIASLLTAQLAGPTLGQFPFGAATARAAAGEPGNTPFADSGPRLTGVVHSVFQSPEAERIESLSGKVLLRCVDLVVPAGAVQLRLTRQLQTFPTSPGLLGGQWRLNWEKVVQRNQEDAAIVENGAATLFQIAGDGQSYRSASGDVLTVTSDGAVCVRADGSSEKFDAAGRLVEQDWRNGNRFTLTYDEKGRLSRVDGPRQTWLTFVVDDRGRVKQAQASNGATVQYGFDQDELPPGDAALRCRYDYDAQGNLSRIEHPRRGPVTLAYDATGRVVERKWADDASERYEFDAATRTVRRIDAMGRTTSTQFSEDMKRLEVADAADRKSVMQLDDLGRPTQATDAAGRTSSTAYDNLGRTTSVDIAGEGVHKYEYAGDARLPAVHVAPDGRRTAMQYDAQQNLVSMSVDGEKAKAFETTYSSEGQVREIADRNGAAMKINYNARGLLESMTDAAGGVTKFELDPQGNILRLTNALGHATVNGYDPAGRLQITSSPGGGTRRYQYDDRGDLVRETDAAGGTIAYEYDVRGRLIAVTDALGRTTRLSYFADGRLRSRIDAAGNEWKLEYDATGNLVREADPVGGITSHQYDAQGRETSIRDAVGVATSYEYTPQGKVSRVVLADGGKATFEHDEQGRVTASTDRYGQTTRHQYDARGNRVETTLPTGVVVTRKFDDSGRLVETSENGKPQATYEYDVRGNVTKLTFGAGYEVSYQYDALGRVVKWTDNLGGGQNTNYDADGRPLESRAANGEAVRYRYDPAGKLLGLSNALGEADRRAYDAAGQLTEFTSPNGERVEYRYNPVGQITSVVKPGGGELKFEYDAAGRLVQSIDPLSNAAGRQYDLAGRIVSSTDAGGRTTTFAYDTAGRLIQKRLSDGTNVLYRYDEMGKLLEIDDGAFPIRYVYDARGNRTKIEYPTIKRSLSYQYDERNRIASFTDSENVATIYAYDEHDQLVQTKRGDDVIRFAYDARGRRTTTHWPNGVRGEWQYDAMNHVTSLRYVGADDKTLAGWTYKYDAGGRLVETVPHEGVAEKFRYDADGQLIERRADAELDRYAYLPGGNRAAHVQNGESQPSHYNAADQLIAVGDDKFAYDASGNLISRTTAAGTTKYEYDAQNQLVGVTLPSGDAVRYGYAATGQPIWREDKAGRTWYVTDGLHVLTELDAQFNAQVGYAHGLGIDQPLAEYRGAKSTYLHADRLGTPAKTSNAQGGLEQSFEYDAFGQPRGNRPADALPIGFTGHRFDQATGLYYYRARWYDPALGRYLSPDPAKARISMPLTLNPYQYALNNPTGYVDPSGATELADGLIKTAMKLGSPEQAIKYLAEAKQSVRTQHVDQVDRALEGPHSGTPAEVEAKYRQDLTQLGRAQQAIKYATSGSNALAGAPKVPSPPRSTPPTPEIPSPTTPGPTSPPSVEPTPAVAETAPEPKPAALADADGDLPSWLNEPLATGPDADMDPFAAAPENALADQIELPEPLLASADDNWTGRPRGTPRTPVMDGGMNDFTGAAVNGILGNNFAGAVGNNAGGFIWFWTFTTVRVPGGPVFLPPNRGNGLFQAGAQIAAAILTGLIGGGPAPAFAGGVPIARTINVAPAAIPAMTPPNRPAPPGPRAAQQTAGTGQPAPNNPAAGTPTPANQTPANPNAANTTPTNPTAANNPAATNPPANTAAQTPTSPNSPSPNNLSPAQPMPTQVATASPSGAKPDLTVASVTPTPNIPSLPVPQSLMPSRPLPTDVHIPPPMQPAVRTPPHPGGMLSDFVDEATRVPDPPSPKRVSNIATLIQQTVAAVVQAERPNVKSHGQHEAEQAAALQRELTRYRDKGRHADQALTQYEQEIEAYNERVRQYNEQVAAHNRALAEAAAQQARERVYTTYDTGGYYNGGHGDYGANIGNWIQWGIQMGSGWGGGGGYGGHGH